MDPSRFSWDCTVTFVRSNSWEEFKSVCCHSPVKRGNFWSFYDLFSADFPVTQRLGESPQLKPVRQLRFGPKTGTGTTQSIGMRLGSLFLENCPLHLTVVFKWELFFSLRPIFLWVLGSEIPHNSSFSVFSSYDPNVLRLVTYLQWNAFVFQYSKEKKNNIITIVLMLTQHPFQWMFTQTVF